MYADDPKPKRMRDQRGWLMRDASMGALASHTCASVLSPAMLGVNAVNEMRAREARAKMAVVESLV